MLKSRIQSRNNILLFLVYYLTMQVALTMYTIAYCVQVMTEGHSITGYEIMEYSDLVTFFVFICIVINQCYHKYLNR